MQDILSNSQITIALSILSMKQFREVKDMYEFIVEIRKQNGEQYPSISIYDLVSGISLYLEGNMVIGIS